MRNPNWQINSKLVCWRTVQREHTLPDRTSQNRALGSYGKEEKTIILFRDCMFKTGDYEIQTKSTNFNPSSHAYKDLKSRLKKHLLKEIKSSAEWLASCLVGLVVVIDSSPDFTCQLPGHRMQNGAFQLNTREHLSLEEDKGNSEEKGNVCLCLCACDTFYYVEPERRCVFLEGFKP